MLFLESSESGKKLTFYILFDIKKLLVSPDLIFLMLSEYIHLISLHFNYLGHLLLLQDSLLLMQRLTTAQYAESGRFLEHLVIKGTSSLVPSLSAQRVMWKRREQCGREESYVEEKVEML